MFHEMNREVKRMRINRMRALGDIFYKRVSSLLVSGSCLVSHTEKGELKRQKVWRRRKEKVVKARFLLNTMPSVPAVHFLLLTGKRVDKVAVVGASGRHPNRLFMFFLCAFGQKVKVKELTVSVLLQTKQHRSIAISIGDAI